MITLPLLLGCLEECRRVIKKRTNVCDYGNHTLNFHPLPPLSQGVSAFSSLLQEYFVIAFLVGEGCTWLPMPQGTVSCVQVLWQLVWYVAMGRWNKWNLPTASATWGHWGWPSAYNLKELLLQIQGHSQCLLWAVCALEWFLGSPPGVTSLNTAAGALCWGQEWASANLGTEVFQEGCAFTAGFCKSLCSLPSSKAQWRQVRMLPVFTNDSFSTQKRPYSLVSQMP